MNQIKLKDEVEILRVMYSQLSEPTVDHFRHQIYKVVAQACKEENAKIRILAREALELFDEGATIYFIENLNKIFTDFDCPTI